VNDVRGKNHNADVSTGERPQSSALDSLAKEVTEHPEEEVPNLQSLHFASSNQTIITSTNPSDGLVEPNVSV
jgi:hypothetical protein